MRTSTPPPAENPPHPEPEGRHSPTAPRRERWHQRGAVRALVAAAIFVIGVALGGVIVGFAMNGSKPALPRRTVTTTAPVAPNARGGSRAPIVGAAAVNNGCLRAINDSQTAYSGLGRLAAALRALDASRIDHLLVDMQARQQQLQQDLGACHINGRVATVTAAPSKPGR